MFARFGWTNAEPASLDRVIAAHDETIVPQVSHVDGFRGTFACVDRSSGRCVVVRFSLCHCSGRYFLSARPCLSMTGCVPENARSVRSSTCSDACVANALLTLGVTQAGLLGSAKTHRARTRRSQRIVRTRSQHMDAQVDAWSRRRPPADYTSLETSVAVPGACHVVNPRVKR